VVVRSSDPPIIDLFVVEFNDVQSQHLIVTLILPQASLISAYFLPGFFLFFFVQLILRPFFGLLPSPP
jgi:hypothetical protein